MNKKFRDIAEKYGITQEVGQDILLRIKIENPTKNPSKVQVEAFDHVCQSLQKGIELDKAITKCLAFGEIASCLAENELSKVAKESQKVEEPMQQSNSNGHVPHQASTPEENPSMDSVTTEVAKEIAQAMYQNVPGIAQTKFLEMKGNLERNIEKFFVANVLGGDFKKNFENFVNADVEEFKQGKLNPPKNNSALPPGS